MGLNANQKAAVEYLDGPLLVLAGPGTGKTQLLSEKVAYILQNTDTNPENILCLTFTDTGAYNMRERLRTIVGKAAMKVNIGTYHAFGSEILAQYKNYTDQYNRVLDASIDEVTQYKIIQSIQSELPATDILRGDKVKDIISVISEAKSAQLSADDLEAIARQNIADSEVLSEAIAPLLANVVLRDYKTSHDEAYRPIFELLKQYVENAQYIDLGPDSEATVERTICGIARSLQAAIDAAELDGKIKPLSDWKDEYFEKDGKGAYRLRDRIANKKLLSVANVMNKYQDYLLENDLFDFDDMIEEAVKVLKTDTGFKLTLEERYQFIMLDEFQDTNPSQLAIVKELTDYDKPMIMAVGDDDQAIYTFQGALSSNLMDFRDYYGAHTITLTENYRSTQEILDFSHEIIKQETDRFDKELTAHKPNPSSSQIFRYEFLSSIEEYGFVADKIAGLIESGVKQSDIAIISYKTKYFLPLLPYLKSHPEIKIAYEKRDNLLEDEKIHEILTISKLIHDVANENRPSVSMIEVLSYPFFELPVLEVVKLVGQAKAEHKMLFEYLLESDNEKIRSVMEFFSQLIAKAHSEPLATFLDYVIGTLPLGENTSNFLKYYTEHAKDEYEIFSFYENLAALRGATAKHFGDKPLKLSDLIEMISDYEAADMAINVKSPYRDADDAVQILSAHKAKGLEFRYVFIISADHTAWGKGKGNNNLLSLPKNLIHIRHTGTTDGEKLRVLYVALTRAKETLIITNALHDFNDKDPKRLEYFDEYEEGDVLLSPYLPTKEVIRDYSEGLAVRGTIDGMKNYLMKFVTDTPDMRAIYKERIANWRMSASALTSFVDISYGGPVEFFESRILRAPREPETEILAMGNLIHAAFEKVTNDGLSDEEALKYFLEELDNRDVSSEIKQAIRERGPEMLATSLKEFSSILRSGKAEVDFARDNISVAGVPLTGKIDHMIIDEENKTIEVYDFKTRKFEKGKWESSYILFKYMLQLEFYKLLIENSVKYSKYKVTRGHILFVGPDKDGLVYDKAYDFMEDNSELIRLIESIYKLTTTLEFMDDPEIFIQPSKDYGLADIKKFIELLLAKSAEK